MLRSLNEVEQTARKAAKGCGLPWGVADEVAKSVRWLQAFGIDAISPLSEILPDHHPINRLRPESLKGVWKAPGGVLSPLMVGLSLSDCVAMSAQQTFETEKITYPVLAAGFLGQASLLEADAVVCGWCEVQIRLYRNELLVSGNQADLLTADASSMYCRAAGSSTYFDGDCRALTLHVGDTEVNSAAWDQLEKWVYKTYVEATEESRLHGAGAGLNDND